MFPYVIIFGKTIGIYGVLSCIGALAAAFLLYYLLGKRSERSVDDMILFFLFVGGGLLFGGHLLYGITNFREWGRLISISESVQFRAAFYEIFGGSVFYGGLIGGAVCGVLGTRLLKLDTRLYADGMAVSAPFFHFFGRIGCFFAGCCYGIESEFGFVLNGVRRFPVQLLEATVNLLIATFLFVLYIKRKNQGTLFFLYLAIYALVRFLDEFLRGDPIRGFVLGLSTSQFISIFVELFALGALLYCWHFKRHDRKEQKAL